MATILIVEDDRKTNEAICEYLKPAGHTLIPAYDGEEALNLFRANGIDLVVLGFRKSAGCQSCKEYGAKAPYLS